MARRHLSALALAALTSGCVIGRAARPSQTESAQGPSAVPVTGSPVTPQIGPDTNEGPHGPAPKPGTVWVRGYWHWDGVSYVWQRGHWEQANLGG